MGIPKLQSRYIKPILSTQRSVLPTDVTSLHIDATATIYEVVAQVCGFADEEKFDTVAYLEAVQRASTPSEEYEELDMLDIAVIEGFVRKIQEYFNKYNPTRVMHVAGDGLPPSGKLNQQRTRRWLSARRRLTPMRDQSDIEDRSSKSRLLFDTNKITPGTRFMEVLDEIFMARFPTNRHISQSSCVFIYSSYRDDGEGEHKIMRLLRSGVVPSVGSHLIVSSDSDMVILASLLPIPNVYVYRETINTIVNISMLKFHLGRMYNKNTYRDSVLLLQVLGNDFLPPQPSFLPGPDGQVMPPSTAKDELPTSLFDVYHNVGRELVSVDETGRISIDWEGLKEVLQGVAENEYERLALVKRHATEKDARWSDIVFSPQANKDEAYQAFRAAWYAVALADVPVDERPTMINRMCSSYIRTMAWTCVYYFEGAESSTHIYPYRYAPLLSDIVSLNWRGEYEKEMRVSREDYLEGLPTLPQQVLAVIPEEQSDDNSSIFALIQSTAPEYFPSPLSITVDTLGLAEGEDAEIVAVGGLPAMGTKSIVWATSTEFFAMSDADTAESLHSLFEDIQSSSTRYDARPTLVVEIKGVREAPKPRQKPVRQVEEPVAAPSKAPPKAAAKKAAPKAPPKAPVKAPPKAPVKVPAKK
jgi:5'-3' exonuclease